jgi:prevent-host-death family protein
MKALTASQLRADVYRLLDRVIETGEPLEVQRGRKKVRIIPIDRVKRTERLKKRNWIVGDPEKIVTVDWSTHWRPPEL